MAATLEQQSVSEPYILFELAGTTYGVRSRDVRQMEMIEHITAVPNAPAYLDGVVFSRGQVIPAMNLRMRFGFERAPLDLRARLIVTQIGDRTIGFVVDSAREFISIESDTILPPPEEISGLSGKYLEGISRLGQRIVLILNLEEVVKLTSDEALAAIDKELAKDNDECGMVNEDGRGNHGIVQA